jgi:alpha-tubulin suppressor-like RCC1 family protein
MNRNETVPVKDLKNAISVAAGDGTTCALRNNGEVMCWGTGHPGSTLLPANVASAPNGLDIDAGFGHVCLLRDNGRVACWGRNGFGQAAPLASGPTVSAPTAVDGVSDAIAIGVGAQHSCALVKQGKVLCWGANQFGQLGTGDFVDSAAPVEVLGL